MNDEPTLRDLRCVSCGRLLLRYSAEQSPVEVTLKCTRCKTLQERQLAPGPSLAVKRFRERTLQPVPRSALGR